MIEEGVLDFTIVANKYAKLIFWLHYISSKRLEPVSGIFQQCCQPDYTGMLIQNLCIIDKHLFNIIPF